MYWIVLAVLLHIADVSYCNSNVDEHCSCIENKYDAAKNELSKEEMFKRGLYTKIFFVFWVFDWLNMPGGPKISKPNCNTDCYLRHDWYNIHNDFNEGF